MNLWHVSEKLLEQGDFLTPGRWGAIVAANSALQFHVREMRLEKIRMEMFPDLVSRLRCSFAFGDVGDAISYAEPADHIYRVMPVPMDARIAIQDMLWKTWIGETGGTDARVDAQGRNYWAGVSTQQLKPDAKPIWEYLVDGRLQVIERVR